MKFFNRLFGGNKDSYHGEPAAQEVQDGLKDWVIVEIVRSETGDAAVLRMRTRKPKGIDSNHYSTAVTIKWSYESDLSLPNDEDNQKMVAFESAIDELSGMNGLSELVQVMTGMGVKEWIYYTNSRDVFMRRFNGLLQNHERYPLEIVFYDDPNWEIWQDMLAAVESKSSQPSDDGA
jgi:hypothetical protein